MSSKKMGRPSTGKKTQPTRLSVEALELLRSFGKSKLHGSMSDIMEEAFWLWAEDKTPFPVEVVETGSLLSVRMNYQGGWYQIATHNKNGECQWFGMGTLPVDLTKAAEVMGFESVEEMETKTEKKIEEAIAKITGRSGGAF